MQGFAGLFSHTPSQACLVDLVPPTFAGITALAPQAGGGIVASWNAASDASPPASYEVYVKASTATDLFNTANIALVTRNLSASIFQLANLGLLQSGVTYFVGVRAVDAVGNRDNNVVSLSAVSVGVPDASILSAINALAQNSCVEFVAFSEDEELVAVLTCEE